MQAWDLQELPCSWLILLLLLHALCRQSMGSDYNPKGIRADTEQATAKTFAEQAAIRIAEHCVKIHGGYGVLEDYMPHHYYRHVPMRFGAGGTEESLAIMIANAAFNNEANPDLSHNSMETAGWWGRLEW